MAEQLSVPGTWQDLSTRRTGTLVVQADGVGGGIVLALKDDSGSHYVVVRLTDLRRIA